MLILKKKQPKMRRLQYSMTLQKQPMKQESHRKKKTIQYITKMKREMIWQKHQQSVLCLDLGTGNAALLGGVQLELRRVAEVLEYLTVFIRNCDLHTKNSSLCTRFSIPILTDCAEIGKGTRGFCVFWSGKHSRYVKMISETAAKCIIIEPEKRVQV